MDKMKKKLGVIMVTLLIIIFSYPIVFLLVGSFMNPTELHNNLDAVIGDKQGFAQWSTLPQNPSLKNFVELLLDTPQYFVMFWNSVKIVVGVLSGQILVAIPAAWGLSRYEFKGKKILVTLYIILMMLPFQSVMLSQYIVLNNLGLLDKLSGVILPGVFSTFPVFIMYYFFQGIENEAVEAARLDGANELSILLHIGIPIGRPGIMGALVLGILEYWNLVEAPMIFLKTRSLWPLSLMISEIDMDKIGLCFSSSALTLVTPLLMFLIGKDYLISGIESTGAGGKSL